MEPFAIPHHLDEFINQRGEGCEAAAEAGGEKEPGRGRQQFGVGGKSYGRAFDSSAITGDKGASAKAELQYTPEIELPGIKYLQLYVFGDYGKTWSYVDNFRESYQYLASAGGGFRFGVGERVSGSLEVGNPLSSKIISNDNPGVRAFFSLSARY